MLLKSLLVSIFVPPFLFVPLIAMGLVLLAHRPRTGKILAWGGLGCLTLTALPVCADLLLRGLEIGTPPSSAAILPQAIVVLGAEIERSEDDAAGAHLGLLSLERLRAAALLARETNLPILVSGGLIQLDRPAVADLMAAALEQDFQMRAAWIENVSATTWDNAARSAALLRARGVTSVYVVTHAWHTRRALIAFSHTGLTVIAVPVSSLGPFRVDASAFLPTVSAWQYSYYALHEWIGCLAYTLR